MDSCWACGRKLYRWEEFIHNYCILLLWMGVRFQQDDGSIHGPSEYRKLLPRKSR